jgi:K+-transporting ATPase ATPase C chain
MKELRTAFLVLLVFSLLLGVVYPLVVTGIAQLVFPWRANGSLVSEGGRVVGSELIGQSFSSPRYFHGRPSASGYDAMASGATNLGPSNPTLAVAVRDRVEQIRLDNALGPETTIPADLTLSSGSGLDPEISLGGALLQAERVAVARGLDVTVVRSLVEGLAVEPFLGAFGETRVNVLRLNLALDELP